MKYIVSLFLLFSLNSCALATDDFQSPHYTKYSDRIIKEHAKESFQNEGLTLFGEGGAYMNDISIIDLHYRSQKVVTISEARRMLVQITNSLLGKINNNIEVRPYLHNYPFTIKNLDMSITFNKDPSNDNSVDSIVMFEGRNIEYLKYIKDSWIPKVLHKESYEEALKNIN